MKHIDFFTPADWAFLRKQQKKRRLYMKQYYSTKKLLAMQKEKFEKAANLQHAIDILEKINASQAEKPLVEFAGVDLTDLLGDRGWNLLNDINAYTRKRLFDMHAILTKEFDAL